MPAIRVFGVYPWHVSSDDLVIPAALGTAYLAAWTGLTAAAVHSVGASCGGSLLTFQLLLLAVLGLNLVLSALLSVSSAQGTMLDGRRRAAVPPLLHACVLLYAALLGVNAWGASLLSSSPEDWAAPAPDCDGRAHSIVKAVVVGTWVATGVALLAVLLLLNPWPGGLAGMQPWVSRVRCLFCLACVGAEHSSSVVPDPSASGRDGGQRGAAAASSPLLQLAFALSTLFGNELLTWSDYMTGLVLVGIKQRLQREALQGGGATHSPPALTSDAMAKLAAGPAAAPAAPTAPHEQRPVERQELADALRFGRHAIAVYGHMMHAWAHRHSCTAGVSCLACSRQCACCCRHTPSAFYPASCSSSVGMDLGRRLDREAILMATGMQDEQLLMVCDSNDVAGVLPHYIAADHERRELILSIRGSWSLADVVTDFVWMPAAMSPLSRGNDCSASEAASMSCHQGMWLCALALQRSLRDSGLLLDLLSGACPPQAAAAAAVTGQRAPPHCQGYQLIITGHSLGAGVAAMLGLLLRPTFPDLAVWSFAPPGGSMSPEAAALTREFCTSVVHSKDMVPRLSVTSLQQLVDEMVRLSALCKLNKAGVLLHSLLGRRWGWSQLFHSSWDDVAPAARAALDSYERQVKGRYSQFSDAWAEAGSFVPPGNVLYFQATKVPLPSYSCFDCARSPAQLEDTPAAFSPTSTPGATACASARNPAGSSSAPARSRPMRTSGYRKEYSASWVAPGAIPAGGLLVSRSMFWDHVPDKQLRSIAKALDKLGGATAPSAVRAEKIRAGDMAAPGPMPLHMTRAVIPEDCSTGRSTQAPAAAPGHMIRAGSEPGVQQVPAEPSVPLVEEEARMCSPVRPGAEEQVGGLGRAAGAGEGDASAGGVVDAGGGPGERSWHSTYDNPLH